MDVGDVGEALPVALGRAEGHAGDDGVVGVGQFKQHGVGMLAGGGFADELAGLGDRDGVGGKEHFGNGSVGGGDTLAFGQGESGGEMLGVGQRGGGGRWWVAWVVLRVGGVVEGGCADGEHVASLGEEMAAAGGLAGEDEAGHAGRDGAGWALPGGTLGLE